MSEELIDDRTNNIRIYSMCFDAGQLKLKPEKFDINTVLLELENIYNLDNKKDIEIKFINKNSPPLNTYNDIVKLKQIMSNLIDNALKFTQSGFVKFGYDITDSHNHITLFIYDSGMGIAENEKSKVFSYFHKSSPNNKFYSGTGLGLTICKKLALKMGGDIWFESEPNKGSKFFFTILRHWKDSDTDNNKE
jgi:signal transduction histidine kinase